MCDANVFNGANNVKEKEMKDPGDNDNRMEAIQRCLSNLSCLKSGLANVCGRINIFRAKTPAVISLCDNIVVIADDRHAPKEALADFGRLRRRLIWALDEELYELESDLATIVAAFECAISREIGLLEGLLAGSSHRE
jgi:hypothetical protein